MINSSILNQKDCLKGVLRRVGLTPVLVLVASVFIRRCHLLRVWSGNKKQQQKIYPSGRGHKSAWLPVGRHGKRRPPRLAGRLTAPGEESKHRSEENMVWVLSDAGNQARKCVCACVCLDFCLLLVLLGFCLSGLQCVRVCVSENAFPDSPLVGWKRAINSRVSPGSGPETGALPRK